MKKLSTPFNKTLYAAIFLIAVPVLLWLWAAFTEDLITLPIIESTTISWALIIGGSTLMLWAMLYLLKHGKGLPMNAYPPPKFVSSGPYLLFRHPIYIGFVLLIIGYFILTGSSSGFWLVTPLTILGIIAIVLGYEHLDLKKRFPDQVHNTILDLPANVDEPAKMREQLTSIFWVGLTLLISNFIIIQAVGNILPLLGEPWGLSFVLENHFWMVVPFLLVFLFPFTIRRKDLLRNWAITSILALGFSTYLALLYPEVMGQYFSVSHLSVLSAPVFLTFLVARTAFLQSKISGVLIAIVVLVVLPIQLTNSGSAELHFSSSVLIFFIATYQFQIWLLLKNTSQKIANSWKEWVFGKVRVINHGFYVGFGAFIGIVISGTLVGDDYAWALLVFSVVVILFSALWAQVIEGSEKLKRPYGYYGALVGIVFASLAVWAMGFDVWIIIGVISVVMPWVQGIGRLRCLINGCCHGSKVNDSSIGIRYFHFRSRVCGISDLKGELLHPTPLYSIIWLFLVGFVLLVLWNHNFTPPFIFGLYLILNGLGRFVEEAYRGEVQTPILRGLRLYQWTAILSILIGIFMTCIDIQSIVIAPSVGWETLVSAIIGGLFTFFAMGVDFPYSNARFSRLV